MSDVARICEATRRHGNALVLLLLVKTWDGEEPPTRDELATLANISPRQAERDLLKLVEDGEIEKVGRRGQVTRFQIKGLSHVSDETDNERTDVSDAQPSNLSDPAPVQSDMSDESATSDRPLSDSSDTCDRPLSGTPIAPLSAETISSNTVEANASTARGAAGLKFYVGRLIQFRESKLGTKLPKHQAEAAAAKWMFEQGWPIEDVMSCHDFLVGQGRNWRHTGVTLNEVKSQIADWKRGNLSDGARAGPQRNGRTSNVERSMDALKSFIAKEKAGNVRRT